MGRGHFLVPTDKNRAERPGIPASEARARAAFRAVVTKQLPIASSEPVLVSACLAGRACRYDGSDNADPRLGGAIEGRPAVLVCPEEEGDLGTPRPPAEIVGGDGADVLAGRARVVTDAGRDVTDQYIRGAEIALGRAQRTGATVAVLKARSPSCGRDCIYDGSFTRSTRSGDGVTAALLRAHGIEVLTEDELDS
jgi:uncharacterized protein YbbK (DUF523 family)